MISEVFKEALETQAERQGRELTPINLHVAEKLEMIADKALLRTRANEQTKEFQVVSAPTGTSKTQSAIAYAVSRYKSDPKYTCAFVVEQTKLANDIYEQLKQDIPLTDLGVWTTYHDSYQYQLATKDGKEHDDYDRYQFIPDLIDFKEMNSKRIAVYTHKKWTGEMRNNLDHGVRRYLGKLRDNLFVDEKPDIISVIEKVPSDIVLMQELVASFYKDDSRATLLGNIAKQMLDTHESKGNQLREANLKTSLDDCMTLIPLCSNEFFAHISKMPRVKKGETNTDFFIKGVAFLLCCAKGYLFYSQEIPPKFVAYLPSFKPEPNIIILDGTADISASYKLMGAELVGGMPKIDYSNLSIHHIDTPKEYGKRIAQDLDKSIHKARDYANWIKQVVEDNTEQGDCILVVVHKKLIFPLDIFHFTADKPDEEIFNGRKTWFIYWGVGVGSNAYNKANKVFTFGEFYKPKRVTVAETLGYQVKVADNDDLSGLNGRLTGHYLDHYESDLLRWQKQLIARGNVRNVDKDSKCGRMEIYTTMDWKRLIANLDVLYPNASAPTRESKYAKGRSSSKRDALTKFLSSTSETMVSFSQLAEMFDMNQKVIARELNSKTVKPTFDQYGWFIVKAKDIGKSGRHSWVIRE